MLKRTGLFLFLILMSISCVPSTDSHPMQQGNILTIGFDATGTLVLQQKGKIHKLFRYTKDEYEYKESGSILGPDIVYNDWIPVLIGPSPNGENMVSLDFKCVLRNRCRENLRHFDSLIRSREPGDNPYHNFNQIRFKRHQLYFFPDEEPPPDAEFWQAISVSTPPRNGGTPDTCCP